MGLCPKEEQCAFMNCDEKYNILPAMAVHKTNYCESKNELCIRYKLSNKYGEIKVPSNMMPNGLPLPGTHRRDWTTVALQYQRYIKNKDY